MDNIYLHTLDKTKCSGCRACEHACPVNAIKLTKDEEGFLYPAFDAEKCIDCGICHKVCPVSNPPVKEEIRETYSLQHMDEASLLKSASGGVFIGIAKEVIKAGGIVFGCIFNTSFEAITAETESIDGLEKMQGSKYVSSDTSDSFIRVKEYLEKGRTVFFTGAPCQVAGLKNFLRKPYDNLYTMDFLCHGMPSQTFFEENIKYLQNKHKGVISDYQFRDKTLKGWGHVTSYTINGKKHYEPGKLNAYFYGFINGYLNRYTCYECPFRGSKRASDITVGDFWGCDVNSIDTAKGVSFAAVNTDNGTKLLSDILKKQFAITPVTIARISKENGTINSEHKDCIPEIRKKIYKILYTLGFKATRKRFLIPKDYFIEKIVSLLPQKLKKTIIKTLKKL